MTNCKEKRPAPGMVLVTVALLVGALAPRSRADDLAVNAYCPFPIGSPRVVGMAGAFTGIGSGAASILANPAAVLRPDGMQLGSTSEQCPSRQAPQLSDAAGRNPTPAAP